MSLVVTELVGHRALLSTGDGYRADVQEWLVVEVSPAGQWVKLRPAWGGRPSWLPVTKVKLVEVLRDLKPAEPKPGGANV